ncbi:MAG: DUF456 domain-containing protein [Candidatus Aminicenantia bacterium]
MVVLIIIGFILVILGIIGCIVPGIPGPPLNFIALIFLSIAKRWEPFSITFLILMAAVTIVVTGLDYVLPAAGAKKYGASKFGFWGSIIGMLIGIVFAPPLGMIIGAFIGAVIGETLIGKRSYDALKAGWGVFIGTMLGIALKLAASGIMAFYFVKALF